jgi:hypothetical protein
MWTSSTAMTDEDQITENVQGQVPIEEDRFYVDVMATIFLAHT